MASALRSLGRTLVQTLPGLARRNVRLAFQTQRSKSTATKNTIGIDLGTTNSCVAVVEGTTPRVIENAEGARTTPSVVAFLEDGTRLVGTPAKRSAITMPEATFFATKRLIGRRFDDPMTQKDMGMVPYKIVRAANGDAWVSARGKEYSPSQIGAFVLMKMKETAESFLGSKTNSAVITVPAYFDDSQRQATKDAGKIAGFDEVRIVNEPTAAAMAFGLEKTGHLKVGVYDLGGGTFDVSILEIQNGVFEVRATNGDTFLGGEDFDVVLVEHLLGEFKREQGIDLSKDRMAMQRLREAAEKAKCELSTTTQTEINLPFITANASGPKHMTTKLTRAKLEALTRALVEKTIEPCRVCLKDAKVDDPSSLSQVLLVGGMTRMPLVRQTVQRIFGKEGFSGVNPDEAVAVGAAIQSAVLDQKLNDIILIDMTPISFGIETLGGAFTRIVERNTSIPTQRTRVFSTSVDGQQEVEIKILTGERELAADCRLLATTQLTGIPPMQRGQPQIEVMFDIGADGIISVSAKEKGSGKSVELKVDSNGGLSKTDIERMVKEAAQYAAEDLVKRQSVEAKNSAEAAVYSTERALKDNGDALAEADKSAIATAVADLRKSLEAGNVTEITSRTAELTKSTQKLFEKAYQAKKGGAAGGAGAGAGAGADKTVDAEYKDVSKENK